MSDNKTPVIKRRYDRIAKFYDILDAPMEMMAFQKNRKQVLDRIWGKALEIGVGTGRNIEYYPDSSKLSPESQVEEIIAIDFSQNMIQKARERANKVNKPVTIYEMDVQELQFADEHFDSAFSTCVFCSVPDPIRGLTEIKRVLKPGGELILLEHVKSSKLILGTIMNFINPITVTLWGANVNRETVSNVRKAGFEINMEENLSMDILKLIVAKKPLHD